MPIPVPSQKFRPIGFYLSGAGLPPAIAIFAIRPEDMTHVEPSRLTVQSTMGGAWADVFDRGIAGIRLSGHTGWRGGVILSGEGLFYWLRDTVFSAWHARRALAIQLGTDPDSVQLVYIDTLDNIAALVAPRSVQLRRNRSRPLLYMFHIDLLVLADADAPFGLVDAALGGWAAPMRWIGSSLGLGGAVTAIVGPGGMSALSAINSVGGIALGDANSVATLAQQATR